MKLKTLLVLILQISISFAFIFSVSAQEISSDEFLYKAELEKFVNKKAAELGKNSIPRERFLIQQMRMLNAEIRSRIKNTSDLRQRYFDNLESKLQEIKNFKSRINGNNAGSLRSFINELEARIEATIESGKIDYKRQKVFEDGIQLLYIAEEMVNLDPNAKIDSNPKISKGLQDSKQKFLTEFGTEDKKSFSSSQNSEPPSIFNLFKEWQLTSTYKYEVRWTDVQIVKNKLLNSGTVAEYDRMLKRELENAATAFNYGYYNLADRSFEEILARYKNVRNVDDIYFYRAESKFNLGQYQAARDLYLKLVETFPTSYYSVTAYSQLIAIAFHFDEYAQAENYYNEYDRLATPNDPTYYNTQLMSAHSAFNSGNYENVVNIISKIGIQSEYYFDAQLLLGKAYIGAENLAEAENVYKNILRIKGLEPEYRFDVLLKLAFINYENGVYNNVVTYLNQINKNYSNFDQVLLTYGWTHYLVELARPTVINRDFSMVVSYLTEMINDYPESDYQLEAKTLLGYVYQMQEKVQLALNQYNYVYQSRFTKEYSDRLIIERDSLKTKLKTTEILMEKALAKKNKAAFIKAKTVNANLEEVYKKISYTDISSTGVASKSEVGRVSAQIAELDKIYKVADERGDSKIKERAKNLRDRLVLVLNSFPYENTVSPLGINYFDEHQHARKESVIEDQNAKVLAMRDKSKEDRGKVREKMDDIDSDMNKARLNKDFKELIHLEIQRHKFEDLDTKLDYLESYAYALDLQQSFIDLQKWSDFGGFGIANVNFAIKNLKNEKVSEYSDQINKINRILDSRKKLLEHKINLIEGEINLMTRQVRQQERLREREELKRKFEESYFDTHTTEVEKSNVVPPQFEDEN